jgi:hypothetical protein
MKITEDLIPFIEKALGFELYENQKSYLILNDQAIYHGGRCNGKTTAFCIKLALSEGDPIKLGHPNGITDENHGNSYISWFQYFFLGIWRRLKDAGFPVREIQRQGGIDMHKYITCKEVTKEVLDSLQVGDLVKINAWGQPMRVRGTSENYAVMAQNVFGKTYYSVIEKKPRTAGNHNEMIRGLFHCGPDFWLFGPPFEFAYKFDDAAAVQRYLQSFETGESELSERSSIPIHLIQIKKCDRK